MTDVLVYAQPEHVDPASIPIIDFALFLSGTMSDRHAVADRIAQACHHFSSISTNTKSSLGDGLTTLCSTPAGRV